MNTEPAVMPVGPAGNEEVVVLFLTGKGALVIEACVVIVAVRGLVVGSVVEPTTVAEVTVVLEPVVTETPLLEVVKDGVPVVPVTVEI